MKNDEGDKKTFIVHFLRSLSDVDNDGKLTCEEFCLAMHLVDVVKSGAALPQKLPPDLIPPSYRRGRSGSGVGIGLPPGGIGAPPGPPLSPGRLINSLVNPCLQVCM